MWKKKKKKSRKHTTHQSWAIWRSPKTKTRKTRKKSPTPVELTEFAKDLEKNELGEIKVNRYNQTNIPGIFAAGDVTDVPEKQIIVAAGEGAKATLGVFRYLSEHK